MTVAVVAAVYGNEATLAQLAVEVGAALQGRQWRLRLVVDASPDASLVVACDLAAADRRIAVTPLGVNLGQHRALARGLADEPTATAWVCIDADLQDPPAALPQLLDRLAVGDVGAVFGGRRGSYETPGRLRTGILHRALLARLTGLPPDAGAYVVLGSEARAAVVALGGPSVVAAIGISGVPTASIPVERRPRSTGRSAWTSRARLSQSVRTLAWAAARRTRAG